MKIKTLWNSITPFNNRQDVPTAFYVIKKVLGFLFIYAAAAFVGEAVIIGALLIMGYDPLNGILPVGHLAELLKYYGFVGFLLVAVFALLYHLRANIYIVGGLHCLWNFLLYGVMGLSISGSAGNENALLQFRVPAANILNGGVYGMEAGIITTAVLTITVAILAAMSHKRRDDNGV